MSRPPREAGSEGGAIYHNERFWAGGVDPRKLQNGGFCIFACEFAETSGTDLREFNCKLHWRPVPYDSKIPEVVRSLTT
jgi:hypothetical protein